MSNHIKKDVEKAVAQRFLNVYNSRMGSNYEIVAVGETPDIKCEDKNRGVKFDLELTILENLKGDAKKEFERIRGEREAFDLSNGQRGNFDNILSNLEILLDNKLNARYENTRTALVIGRVTSIWSCNNWRTLPGIKEKVQQIIQGKENNYPMGIWMFCASENSFEEDILNLVTIYKLGSILANRMDF